ncbi:hypothetical protein M1466_01715 [Candidatus Dependentiae bacterium]|nr:hypothetical protein [Candidatus Dependentiae bacterium]
MQAGQQESSIGGFLQEQGGMIKELVLNSRELLTQLVIYGLGSIALGFFIKRYFQFVLVSIVVVVITYLLLENVEAITIDWARLQELVGINAQQSVGELATELMLLLRQHWLVVLVSVLGFVIGYSIG